MQRRIFASILLALAPQAVLLAQTSRADPVDLQGRLAMQLKLDLPRKWDAAVGYEARMVGNASAYHGSYVDGELGRALGKYLTMFGNYRLAKVTGDPLAHRFGIGAEAERKVGRYSVAFRPMFQYQPTVIDDDAEQGSSEALRTRLKLKIPSGKRLTLHASSEPYFAFTGIYPVDNWRNTVGAQWEFLKGRKLDLYYIYRPDYAKQYYNRTYHIIGAEISSEMKIGADDKPKKKR